MGALELFEQYGIRRILLPLFYLLMIVWSGAAWYETGFSVQAVGTWGSLATIAASVPGIILFILSVLELLSYLVFLPIAGRGFDALSQVHTESLLIPISSSILFLTMAANILTGSVFGWGIWIFLFLSLSTLIALAMKSQFSDMIPNDADRLSPKQGFISELFGLVLGAEIVTVSAGAIPLSPWKLEKLPLDTWIVDVRTKAEFQWNRIESAENFPWGVGLHEAALAHPKNQPVLVTCFSGHRSPSVAAMLRKMGFEQVYNLHWGLIYYMILNRGKKQSGPFRLTRSSRDTRGRGKDYKAISVGYVFTQFIMLVSAPVEKWTTGAQLPVIQQLVGGIIGLGGFIAAYTAYKALGRNFRVFAAPRRSGTLMTGGIYSKVRHPMYTSVILAFLGYVIFWGSTFAFPFWVVMTVLYLIKGWKEEGVLEQRYPDYADYRRRTWMFLPYIY